jgi:hypothetical protein
MKYHLSFLKITSTNTKRFRLFLFAILIFQMNIEAQETNLFYDVIRKGEVIGTINLQVQVKDNKSFLLMRSNVKTRFIFSFSDYCEEAATYDDGIMIYSSFYQKQNGSDKASKKTIAYNDSYKLVDNGVAKVFKYSPIRYNTLLLYCAVPENITKVYSDNYQKLLDLKKTGEHTYRLTMPDGNYNYYTYSGGICNKVVIERTFFTVQFVLKNR